MIERPCGCIWSTNGQVLLHECEDHSERCGTDCPPFTIVHTHGPHCKFRTTQEEGERDASEHGH